MVWRVVRGKPFNAVAKAIEAVQIEREERAINEKEVVCYNCGKKTWRMHSYMTATQDWICSNCAVKMGYLPEETCHKSKELA